MTKEPAMKTILLLATTFAALSLPGAAQAQHAAHVHGQVQVDVTVDGPLLSVRLEAPLDSLVGFEHRPRTAAQKQAAQAALARIEDVSSWLRPAAAAGCEVAGRKLDADALQPALAGADPHAGHAEHADLVAEIELRCATPAALKTLDLALFQAFPRIRRVDVRVAGPAGQLRQTLRAPTTTVRLAR
jgi:hypothetical protein